MNSRLKSIKIPIANSQEYVEIFPDELPEDVNDVLDVLKAELAPLKIWRAVAVNTLLFLHFLLFLSLSFFSFLL